MLAARFRRLALPVPAAVCGRGEGRSATASPVLYCVNRIVPMHARRCSGVIVSTADSHDSPTFRFNHSSAQRWSWTVARLS